uniref:C2H2-type domain-containing protein n=1 Tax=Megaselia scalaris TaxID=36166 RepID=T1GKG9_MEGSC
MQLRIIPISELKSKFYNIPFIEVEDDSILKIEKLYISDDGTVFGSTRKEFDFISIEEKEIEVNSELSSNSDHSEYLPTNDEDVESEKETNENSDSEKPDKENIDEFLLEPPRSKMESVINFLEDGKFECKECGKQSTFLGGLYRHTDSHLQRSTLCPVCGKTFKSAAILQYHLSSSDHSDLIPSEKPSKILCCQYSQSNMKNHRNRYKCSDEGLVFPAYANNGRWIKKKTDKPPTTKRKGKARKHINGFVCESCDLKFSSSSRLSIHNAMHHLEKKLNCPDCKQKFSTEFLLRRHLDKHLQFCKCQKCGKSVRRSYILIHEKKCGNNKKKK